MNSCSVPELHVFYAPPPPPKQKIYKDCSKSFHLEMRANLVILNCIISRGRLGGVGVGGEVGGGAPYPQILTLDPPLGLLLYGARC